MAKKLGDLRPVYVVGIGWHRYQDASDTPYVALGLASIREALADAGVAWPEVESSYVATALLGMACGRPMLRHLGASGGSLLHIENASASGSTAFRHACMEVGAGLSDVALAVGVDKPAKVVRGESQAGIASLAGRAIVPFTHFALLTDAYMQRHGVGIEDIARVAVKNHHNGARNPNAQRQRTRTLDEVLGGRRVSGELTPLQCCPVGEGAAAVIVASEEGIRCLGIDPGRAVRVLSSAARSERVYPAGRGFDAELTRETCAMALEEAGVAPGALDIVELHDAFTVEELHYVEGMGICPEGQAAHLLREGAFDIGGRVAVNPSGGLIAMGHPIGPTGIGQIGEIVLQLRGEAGDRQHAGARTGLAHMVGVGAVCYAHVLQA
ncbi:thiolase family protein [Verticiella sediminum]|uniref:propanoyl-CoA C-acyltransferase n=1 Tax=Verticiella sediminum TaxID=1247510 RepID=A0A556B327_9BURK|nr:thiolase family protein [Verticiella sediminum]TSH99255.1 thiolase family protein [Verticiella sediminum]